MTFGLLNALMLLGLAGLAIPPLIHLLNRRRFDVVDWGAMQFLQISETTRRRILIEELLLMLLRMGLIGLLVLALAAPYLLGSGLGFLGGQPNRDVVLIFDGSTSMGYTGNGPTPHEAAKEWARSLIDHLAPGDSVAILQAKQQVVPVLAEPTHDRQRAREALDQLAPPLGGCDWPGAVHEAYRILSARSRRAQRDVIVLSDGQKFGWADEYSLFGWKALAPQLRGWQAQAQRGTSTPPRLWVLNLAPDRPANPPNWALAPLHTTRAVTYVGQQLTFRTALDLRGQKEYRPPYRIRLEVDGRPQKNDVEYPPSARLDNGQVPLTFAHAFDAPGSHLVTVIVDPDPPPGQRPADYQVKDHLPGDNRQDYVVEVLPPLPVLIVDGEPKPNAAKRDTDPLREALAPTGDETPSIAARVVAIQDFTPERLTGDLGKEPGTPPRVLILANVERLTPAQQEAVAKFLQGGGGVLVALGNRVDDLHYNDEWFRDGQGWLPARLDRMARAEPDHPINPLPSSFLLPGLEVFRKTPSGGIANARFWRWWKVAPQPSADNKALPVALLSENNDPFLVKGEYRGGRVLLCTVPLDKSWDTNLPGLPAFVVLTHEMVNHLADLRPTEYNLLPGQPLSYRLKPGEPGPSLTLQAPEGEPRPLVFDGPRRKDAYLAQRIEQPRGPLVVCSETRQTGVYRLRTADQRTIYYTVRPDLEESNLAPCTEADRQAVAQAVPMTYDNDRDHLRGTLVQQGQTQEIWWLCMVGVIGLLTAEVWWTRRIARHR